MLERASTSMVNLETNDGIQQRRSDSEVSEPSNSSSSGQVPTTEEGLYFLDNSPYRKI